jgi:hypothetical protein
VWQVAYATVFDITNPSNVNDQVMLNTDPTFASGSNGTSIYNNAGNGNVTHSREIIAGNPVGTYGLKITTTGSASPDHGGFYFATPTAANKVYVTKIIAKIPVGKSISWGSNEYGTGGSGYWLTSQAGTGEWEEYIFQVNCGSSGTFSSTNFFYLSGGSVATPENPVVWQVAYATVLDITNSKYKTITAKASDSSGMSGYYISTSTTAPTLGSSWTASTSTIWTTNQPIGTYYIWGKDSVNNISTSYSTVTVSNIDILMPVINSVTVPATYGTTNTITINATDTAASAVSNASGLSKMQYLQTLLFRLQGGKYQIALTLQQMEYIMHG